ncbi:MAG TPA: iron-sulfur cluster carrier protein ApbC [Bacteroidetes bacterium]|nr:iron-sulfur cluster carrier protein ApbC [Bacteroidota bacterium]
MINKDQVIERLKTVKYPGYSRDVVSFGVIKDVIIENSKVTLKLNLTSKDPKVRESIATMVREQVESMPGVTEVKLEQAAQEEKAGVSHAPGVKTSTKLLSDVKYKIAVASGKGGVGKSTVAVNLAVALAKRGARVGLFDADIYGPNMPMMMGASEKPKGQGERILPIERYGIKLMSIGFFIEKNNPVIWRGPLVGKAIEQLLRDVIWEDIDYFIFDMPPGTGDAQLSLSSLVNLSGSVIVTTPQEVALSDAVKGVLMFQKVDVPTLGIVENMSYFICPHCGKETDIFGRGGGKRISEELGVPFLGEVPLDPKIRELGDAGTPPVLAEPDSRYAQAFFSIADKILEKLPQP